MGAKYIKPYRSNRNTYWWLVETWREGGKQQWKKLRYFGRNKPGDDYQELIFPFDDGGDLSLALVWKAKSGRWCWRKHGDYPYWFENGLEKYYWDSLFKSVNDIYMIDRSDIYLTKANSKSEAIRKAKNAHERIELTCRLVMRTLR
jgi:hypothetical protein